MKITSINFNGIKLELSGSFITFNRRVTTIHTQMPKGQSLTLEFTFLNNEDNKPEVIADVKPEIIHIKLYNFNNPLGTGSSDPIQVGAFSGRIYFLHYRVYALDEQSDKIFYYTFYSQGIEQPKKIIKNDKK